jgi:hypothetical protein
MRTQTIGASSLSEFAVPVCQSTVIAGLVPATPIKWHGRASLSGVAGTSPATTIPCSNVARRGRVALQANDRARDETNASISSGVPIAVAVAPSAMRLMRPESTLPAPTS